MNGDGSSTPPGAIRESSTVNAVEAAWQALAADWERDEAHARFLHLASLLDRLPDAARHYREAERDPVRQVRARAGLDQILTLAYAKLAAPRREDRPTRGIWVLPVLVLLFMLGLTAMSARILRRPAVASPSVLLAEIVVVAVLPWSRLVRRR